MNKATALQADPDEIHYQLDMNYVMSTYGIDPEVIAPGVVKYLSPLRDDSNPSFDVFQMDGKWRWGDFATGQQASSFDFIMEMDGVSFADALGKARRLYGDFVESDFELVVPERATFDAAEADDIFQDHGPLHRAEQITAIADVLQDMMLQRPGLREVSASALYSIFKLRMKTGSLIVPYYDFDGVLVGYKAISSESKRNAPGSKLCILGINFIKDHERNTPLLITEGETDWIAGMRSTHCSLSVPGAGQQPERMWHPRMDGRDIYLAFDGDDAGMAARAAWLKLIGTKDATALAVNIPEGYDVAKLERDEFDRLLETARPVGLPPQGIVDGGDKYLRCKDDGTPTTEICDWAFQPSEVLTGEEGVAFGGTILPGGSYEIISSSDLNGTNAIIRWSNRRNRSWFGNAQDAQRLHSLLNSQVALLPAGRITERVGLHDGDFVLPVHTIGLHRWRYQEPVNGVGLAKNIHIATSDISSPFQLIEALLATRDPAVSGPVLAWLAAAPCRILFHQFPFLSVAGGSGSGKTTTLETFIRCFSGTSISTNLTSTTPHGVSSYLASTNGLPVMFDEYRQGAREDAKQQLEQQLRDSYTGQPSVKGGLHSDRMKVSQLLTDTPVVVCGEESLTELSHIDRSVGLYLTQGDLYSGALQLVRRLDYTGLAYDYLNWLFAEGSRMTEPMFSTTYPQDGLTDRQNINLGVLLRGWELLRAYLVERENKYLQDLDTTGIISEWKLASSSDPILDAVKWALTSDKDSVWKGKNEDLGLICINVQQLLVDVAQARVFRLPGNNVTTVQRFLEDRHHGKVYEVERLGIAVEAVVLPVGTV